MRQITFRYGRDDEGIYYNPERSNILIKVKNNTVQWVKIGFNRPHRKTEVDVDLSSQLHFFFKSENPNDAVIVGYANNELILYLPPKVLRGKKYYFGYNPILRKFREITHTEGLRYDPENGSAVPFPEFKALQRFLLGQ